MLATPPAVLRVRQAAQVQALEERVREVGARGMNAVITLSVLFSPVQNSGSNC